MKRVEMIMMVVIATRVMVARRVLNATRVVVAETKLAERRW